MRRFFPKNTLISVDEVISTGPDDVCCVKLSSGQKYYLKGNNWTIHSQSPGNSYISPPTPLYKRPAILAHRIGKPIQKASRAYSERLVNYQN